MNKVNHDQQDDSSLSTDIQEESESLEAPNQARMRDMSELVAESLRKAPPPVRPKTEASIPDGPPDLQALADSCTRKNPTPVRPKPEVRLPDGPLDLQALAEEATRRRPQPIDTRLDPS